MFNFNNVFDTLIKITIEEKESIKETIIDSMLPTEDECSWWQVEHIITDLIKSLEYKLYLEDLIEENELESVLKSSNRNIRLEMFEILIKPIVEHYKDNYNVEVDYHWEEIKVSYK